jgi:hypothetical protein
MVSNVVAWRIGIAACMTGEACDPTPGVAKTPFRFACLVCIKHALVGFSNSIHAHRLGSYHSYPGYLITMITTRKIL